MILGDNNLSFIETSALDASNVELAFQNILTGMDYYTAFIRSVGRPVTLTCLQKSIASCQAKPSIRAKEADPCQPANARSSRSAKSPTMAPRREAAAKFF